MVFHLGAVRAQKGKKKILLQKKKNPSHLIEIIINPFFSFTSFQTKNIQFFAASTLYMKIKMHWSEVAVENYETLKIQIIEAIVQHHKGEKSVLSKLCVSVSLSLYMNIYI